VFHQTIETAGSNFLVVVTGGSVAAALVVWALLYVTFIRPRAPERALPYLIVLLGTVFLVTGGFTALVKLGHDNDVKEKHAALQTVLTQLPQVIDVAVGPRRSEVSLYTRSVGEAGRIAQAELTLIQTVTQSHHAFHTAMIATGYETMMKAEPLAADKGFVRTRGTLKEIHALVETDRTATWAEFDKFRAVLQGAQMSAPMKQQFLDAYDAALARDKPGLERFWDLIEGINTEHEDIVDVLAHPHGLWYLSGGKLLFMNKADLANFNAHARKAQALQVEELALVGNPVEEVQVNGTAPPK
jgi:hypothetical protein